jgi:uncharacterized protein YacL
MFLIKRIIVVISSILGACLGIVLLALMNATFHFNLSFSQVSLFGILGGILLGIVSGYYIMYLIVRRARRFISNKLAGAAGRFGFLKRI